MYYTDQQLDEGVAIAGGGYTISWGDLDAAYWNLPTEKQYYETLYIIDQGSDRTIKRLPANRLHTYVRSEEYLNVAIEAVESHLQKKMTIEEIPIMPEGEDVAVNTYITSIGGENALDADLLTAKWKVIGTWARKNILDVNDASYLKLERDGVFLIDENTFLVL